MILNSEKDKSIRKVLNELRERFGQENFKITDYWDADLCGVGIKNIHDTDYLIYISTLNQLPNTYFAEIERANSKTDLTDYSVIGRFENISIEGLSELINKYLILKPTYEQ